VLIGTKAAPIAASLIAFPFVGSRPGPLADTLGMAAALGSLSLLVLFALFAAVRPEGWSPLRAIETAEMVTLWLVALVVVARVF